MVVGFGHGNKIIVFSVDYNSFVDSNMPVSVPKDIEDEADSYFQRIHNLAPHESIKIDEVLEILKRLKESTIAHERVIIIFIHLNFQLL